MNSFAPRRLAFSAGLLVAVALLFWFALRRPSAKPGFVPTAAPVSVPAAHAAGAVLPPAAATTARFRRALEEVRAQGRAWQHSSEFGRLLEEWVAEDAEAALAYVRQLPPGADYTQGVLLVLGVIGGTDPGRALELARELVSTPEQRAIYHLIFARLAAQDPAAAVSRLALVPAGDSRQRALRALADGWAGSDLPAALAWAQKLEAADRAPALEAVLAAVAPTDPLRAIDLARQFLSGSAFDRTLSAALQVLTLSDPRSAAALVSALPAGEVQAQAAVTVARALAAQDPADAIAWIKTLPTGDLPGIALNNVLDVWARKDAVAAGQYVAQLPPGAAQDAAAEHVVRLLAAADPLQAVAWAQALASESARRRALTGVASAWAQRDPAAAARWVAATPAASTEALHGALSYWVLQDAAAARNFVLNLTGEPQVRAAAFIAPSLAQSDPVAAIAWTQTLPTAPAREAALAAAYARWIANAPAAARAWLATANLPAATKSSLLPLSP